MPLFPSIATAAKLAFARSANDRAVPDPRLKTPLTVLSGFLETMRELPLNESDRARYLEMMEQQSSRMQNIVRDLLVLANLEGDVKPPSDDVLDMRAVLRHLEEDADNLSNGRHRIAFDTDEALTVAGSLSYCRGCCTDWLPWNAATTVPGRWHRGMKPSSPSSLS